LRDWVSSPTESIPSPQSLHQSSITLWLTTPTLGLWRKFRIIVEKVPLVSYKLCRFLIVCWVDW
jgi:hypothetical protein